MKKRQNEKRFTVNKKLFAFFQKRKGGRVYYCYSEDEGRTWSKDTLVPSGSDKYAA